MEMRIVIYIAVIANVALGLYLIFREPSPFKGKTYRDYAKKHKERV